jgi:hypothetical protein
MPHCRLTPKNKGLANVALRHPRLLEQSIPHPYSKKKREREHDNRNKIPHSQSGWDNKRRDIQLSYLVPHSQRNASVDKTVHF